MKTIIFFTMILLSIGSLYGQKKEQSKMKNDTIKTSKSILKKENDTIIPMHSSYYFIKSLPQEVSSQKEEFKRNKNNSGKPDIIYGNKIALLYKKEISKDKYEVYYKYWNFKQGEDATKESNLLASIYNDNVYSMPEEDFKQLTAPLYRRFKGFTVGAYSVPFRLRGIGGGNFDFESSLSLQANFILGWGSKKSQRSWFDTSLGLGVTGANLNSKNSLVTKDRTATALTVSLGGLFKPTNYANIGAFIGWDFLGEKDKEVEWKYNGKPWIGLGINISFNELKTKESPKLTNSVTQ